jgi:hypothetical protein
LAELDSGDFRDRIRLVRWLKGAGQKHLFLDRLDFLGVAQILFITCPNHDVPIAALFEVAKQRTPYQTPVAGLCRRIQTSSDLFGTGVKRAHRFPVRSSI